MPIPTQRGQLLAQAAPLAAVTTVIAAIALVLHFAQPAIGRLEIPQRPGEYGHADFATGSNEYPRYANDASGYTLILARPSERVASLSWSIDEFVYTVVPPEKVVAVSESAYSRDIGNVYDKAEAFQPVIGANAEIVLRTEADLVLASSDRSYDFTNILRSAGMPVFRMFVMFTSLDEVAQNILLTGHLTGRDVEARAEYARFQAAVKQASARKPATSPPPRILGLGGRYSYGDQTLFHDIVRAVGGINVGAENGLRGYDAASMEQILRWNPEWIVAGAARGESTAVLERLMNDPAVSLTTAARKKQIVVLENNVFLPMSPYTRLFLEALADALYGPSKATNL